MARRRRADTVEALLPELKAQLERFAAERGAHPLRTKVLQLVDAYRTIKDVGVNTLHEHGLTAKSARERSLDYFLKYVGEVLSGEELAVVSGISDYPRRIRELRVEFGYQIASGASPDEEAGIKLKPDEYMLVVAEPDEDAVRRWKLANKIRRSKGSVQARLLQYLLQSVGRVVTTEELSYIADNKKEFARRVRELRTEQGYAISTKFTGRPDLAVGQYVLESADRISQPHDRKIPSDVQAAVYSRDQHSCQSCGWNHARSRPGDPRILELHHVQQHAAGGPNSLENLVVLCSRCHDELHAGRLTLPTRAR
jgi:hypothetical protein